MSSSDRLGTLRLRSSVLDIRTSSLWRGAFAEFLATLLFVFAGCSSTLSLNGIAIALCFGLGIASMVWIFGDVSGGHINPAVTFAMLITRRISLVRALLYIVAQMVGSITGVAILRALLFSKAPNKFCVTVPAVTINDGQAVGVELMATTILIFTIFAACDNARKVSGSGALAIGLAVSLDHFAFIPVTGASMNPARSFGPAVLSNFFDRHWIYWLGPFAGGLIAGLLYEILFAGAASLSRVRRYAVQRNYDPDEPQNVNSEYQPFPE